MTELGPMNPAKVTIAAIALLNGAAVATPSLVVFDSPCSCHGDHGKARLTVKIDASVPPANADAILPVTPSDVFSWPGPDGRLMRQSQRTGIENRWFALTGRVLAIKAEMDGDLHIALADRSGDKPGIVVAEVPAKPQWCELRKMIFSWTGTRFPLHIRSARKLRIEQAPIITVTSANQVWRRPEFNVIRRRPWLSPCRE
jgi:hypothetical protein